MATRSALRMRLTLPLGRASDLLGLLNFLQNRFARLHLSVEATEGSISEAEIEDKVRETFRQMGVDAHIE
jgi:hypothetical protein